MKIYDLSPAGGQKSFNGKAKVFQYSNGAEILKSYDTNVLRRDPDGTLHRLWSGWKATTGKHIGAFAGINKKAWDALPVEHDDSLIRLVMEARKTPA